MYFGYALPEEPEPPEMLVVCQMGRENSMTLDQYIEYYEKLVNSGLLTRREFRMCFPLPVPDITVLTRE